MITPEKRNAGIKAVVCIILGGAIASSIVDQFGNVSYPAIAFSVSFLIVGFFYAYKGIFKT
jgi:hypothetical protein